MSLCWRSKKHTRRRRDVPPESSHGASSAIASVVKKLEEAEKKEHRERGLEIASRRPLRAINNGPVVDIEDGGPSVNITVVGKNDAVTSFDGGSTESKESAKIEEATRLIDPQYMWEFFSGVIIDPAVDAVFENVEEEKADFIVSQEFRQATARSEHRFANVCHLPLKLILIPLKRARGLANTFASLLEMQFGPLHAALQVGNVVLEWNDSSLVRPHLCKYEDQVMEVDMQRHSKWVQYTNQHQSEIQRAANELDFTEQIELVYMVTSKKKQLIDALIEVITRYNKLYYYHLINRNCQHFVSDALKALEVEQPTAFTGGLKRYFDKLVKGRTPMIPERFKTHQDLDAYIMQIQRKNLIAKIPQQDLEFLLTLYFRFHLESKKLLGKNPQALEEWKCQEENCQMNALEQVIELDSLQLHGFGTIN